MVAEPAERLFSIDEYDRLIEAGILTNDNRVELLDGKIVCVAALGVPHAATVRRTDALFAARLAGRVVISVQSPVHLPPRSEPEPAIVLLRFRADFYSTGHPAPEDVLLLIEVADSSPRGDRDRKLPRYAIAGILEVWLVDIEAQRLLVYR
ncbi:MAG: Uma2 family endonuclease, partial [Dehalococcoidia bacterium]